MYLIDVEKYIGIDLSLKKIKGLKSLKKIKGSLLLIDKTIFANIRQSL